MASGLIFRRKRYTFNSIKQPTYFLQGFLHPEVRGSPRTHPVVDVTRKEYIVYSMRKYIVRNSFRIPSSGFWNVQTLFKGAELVRYSSAVPNLDEQKPQKQVKEASPADCDDAVEDLSAVKAKAKSKQLQESGKDLKFFVQKVKGMLLWIGQTLRAIASMSRFELALLSFVPFCHCLLTFINAGRIG